jgi:hypothetical protein
VREKQRKAGRRQVKLEAERRHEEENRVALEEAERLEFLEARQREELTQRRWEMRR